MKLLNGSFKMAVAAVLTVFVASCSTYKNINYLQDLSPDSPEAIAINKGILIQPKDMISVIVSSRNSELSAMFNLPAVSYQAGSEITGAGNQQRMLGYIVDNEGNIDFPILGTIHVAGQTRWELAKQIKKTLIDEDYIKDPVVTVEFMNFKVSVIGEVARPNTYSIEGDKITILEALSLAGDLTIFGQRNNVTVIREQNGQRVMHQLDLRSVELFNSPAYYLQQNDVVYVTPNTVRAGQSTINENSLKSVSMWVTISSFLATLATLIISATK